MMLQNIDPNLQLILNCVQLGVYVVILGLMVYKLARAARGDSDFLTKFYACTTVITCIEIAMQAYQLSQEAQGRQPPTYIFVIVNLYAMGCEAAAIFFLSDYWYEAKETITKGSTELELKQQTHWPRHALLLLWLLLFTAFITYALVSEQLPSSESYRLILALGCQGIGATILLWAILVQVIRGYELARAVGRYEEWLSSTSINKVNFRCLYWMTSIFMLLRVLFLITATIAIEVYSEETGWEWLAAFIYTGSNCIVLFVYIFGFSTGALQENKVSTLLDGPERISNSTRSRHETELSSSISDRSHH